ncbi:hypothetical protein Taro_018416 [Colocasia esculenta]|uniref:RNase H type-1 domain-containing protein n=1 Tax=Colocasia esculenta TaxID=4460 RepID=A0A843UIN4_COLES|nr:hypothetical protein [Colocasia esculenta]
MITGLGIILLQTVFRVHCLRALLCKLWRGINLILSAIFLALRKRINAFGRPPPLIWKSRCAARFDMQRRRPADIIRTIKLHVGFAIGKMVFKLEQPMASSQILQSYGFMFHSLAKKAKLVRWIPPVLDFCLNVDGASKGNPGLCGGGGCIRDKHGTILLAFSNFYGAGNSLIAETRALCDGLRIAHFVGVRLSAIYSDSSTLVHFVQQGKCPSWHTYRWWRSTRDLLQGNVSILSHVFRETNQVADRLANHAIFSMCNEVFWGFNHLPYACRGPLLIDKTGLMNIRLS